jgi:hypothetical protein
MRILCHIFGCEIEEYGAGCRRCGTWIYDYPFIQQEGAWLNPWYRFKWWLTCNRDWFYHRCAVCKKPMTFIKDECCSPECYENWYPF